MDKEFDTKFIEVYPIWVCLVFTWDFLIWYWRMFPTFCTFNFKPLWPLHTHGVCDLNASTGLHEFFSAPPNLYHIHSLNLYLQL